MTPKLQRWTDLLVALLRVRFGATFNELARSVPAYQLPERASAKAIATVKRMFERDKAELLAFGVPIETVRRDEETDVYRLRPADFYMPYLALHQGPSTRRTRRVNRDGYHSIKDLTFEPDEVAVIADAAVRARQAGNALLVEHVTAALRKLAFDLPEVHDASDEPLVVAGEQLDRAIFPVLNQALLGRKTLTFEYHSIGRNATETRTVEPLGLFFLSGHWYLAARDAASDAVKNFRLTRMRGVAVNGARPQSPDFDISASFDLREHARSRLAWELGDDDALDVVVEFVAVTGAALPAMRLGTPVEGHPDRRRFRVRSLDRFVRWTLGFAGAARPVSPPDFVDAFDSAVRDVLAIYEREP